MTKGYYNKYNVTKKDGTPVDPKAVYFVLRLDTDPVAQLVLAYYAELIARDNPRLSKDIQELYWSLKEPQDDKG